MRKWIILLAMLALPVCPAWADGIPDYDSATHCAETRDPDFGTFSQCMERERLSVETLKLDWERIPSDVREYCQEMTSVGPGSYWLLIGCATAEMWKRKGA
jgi:hypothetical protein